MVLPNHIWRYAPIVQWFGQTTDAGARCWLEVGSGVYGIGPHMPENFRFVGCDQWFGAGIEPRMLPVRADACCLPFPSRSFDGVLALDMLEHVPPANRPRVVSELARVARRWLIIGFPSGTAAERVDRWLGRFYAWRKIPAPPWLIEHFQYAYPTLNDIRVTGWRMRVVPNEHVLWHLASMILETRPRYQQLIRSMYAQSAGMLHTITNMVRFSPAYRYIAFLERNDRTIAGHSNL